MSKIDNYVYIYIYRTRFFIFELDARTTTRTFYRRVCFPKRHDLRTNSSSSIFASSVLYNVVFHEKARKYVEIPLSRNIARIFERRSKKNQSTSMLALLYDRTKDAMDRLFSIHWWKHCIYSTVVVVYDGQ